MMTKWLMALAAAPFLLAQAQPDRAAIEKAVLEVSAQMTQAGKDRDADRLFSHILDTDRGSIIQNGNLMVTRAEALAQVKANLGQVAKVDYRWTRQLVTVLSPTTALLVSEGESTAVTADGRTFSVPLAQTMVLVLSQGEWKALHAHQSSPQRR